MEKTDILIIGAGIAGLSAALYASRSGSNCLVLDSSSSGGQALEIDKLENYPGIFPAIKGSELIENIKNQAASFGAKIIQAKVESIDKKGSDFSVKTDKNEYQSKALIFATGAEHSKAGIPGEEKFAGSGVSYCAVCDGPFFKNKNLTVIGGGDSACSETLYLASIASHIDLIVRKDHFRASKNLVDIIHNNEKIKIHFNTIVKEIRGENKVKEIFTENLINSEFNTLKTDAVFIFTGMKPRTSLLETLKKDSNGYLITDEKMATGIPGLFAAGDVRAKPLRQLITAASDGAIAGISASEYIKNR